jgi:hypothetical protein
MNTRGILAEAVPGVVECYPKIGAMLAQICGGERLQAINFGDGSS